MTESQEDTETKKWTETDEFFEKLGLSREELESYFAGTATPEDAAKAAKAYKELVDKIPVTFDDFASYQEGTTNTGLVEKVEKAIADYLEAERIALAMEETAAIANRLVEGQSEFGRLVGSMLASRQLYAMCLYELDRLCDETDFKKATKAEGKDNLKMEKELPAERKAMLKEVLINAAAIQAQKPFDENQLFQGMANTVIPWMQSTVVRHNELQRDQQKQAFEAAEVERVATPISLSIQIEEPSDSNSGFYLDRKQSVCFVGEDKVLYWLMDRIAEQSTGYAESNIKQVLRLYSAPGKPGVASNQVWNIPKDDWKEVAGTNNAFQRLYEAKALPSLSEPVDLLIVDDLSHASQGLSVSSLTTRANEAQRKFKKWSEKAGCLLVGCIALPRPLKANELLIPEYETLKMHNVLRGVAAEPVEVGGVPHYKVLIGKYEYAVVPATHIDEYQPSNIVEA
jgi:hypothetical protein